MDQHVVHSFQGLPAELRSAILSLCTCDEILKVCLTSKGMYHACAVFISQIIDLSSHNQTEWTQHVFYPGLKVPADHPWRFQSNREHAIQYQQCLVENYFSRNPSLGRRTQILRCTTLPRPEVREPKYPVCALWPLLSCFTNLTEIDIAFMSDCIEPCSPAPPFGLVTSVTLAGVASFKMVASIFGSINLARLRYLKINNLQTFSEGMLILGTLSEDVIRARRADRAGGIQGLLPRLTGQCTSLPEPGSLEIFPINIADEHSRYGELGAFISSVKPSLQDLLFEHGPDVAYYCHGQGYTGLYYLGPSHNTPLPMNEYFEQRVLPHILAGPWPRLKRCVIRGIGHWKLIFPAVEGEATPEEAEAVDRKRREFKHTEAMIRDALSKGQENIKIEIKDTASKPIYRFQDDFNRDKAGRYI